MITIDGVIVEEGFIGILKSKKNKDEILDYITTFQRNRTVS